MSLHLLDVELEELRGCLPPGSSAAWIRAAFSVTLRRWAWARAAVIWAMVIALPPRRVRCPGQQFQNISGVQILEGLHRDREILPQRVA
jgi:hypothetical protein